jgi:hypothetical protein
MDMDRIDVTGYTMRGKVVGKDTSDGPWQAKSVRLTYPIGGETVRSGTPYPIRWEVYGTARPIEEVKLHYSTDGGYRWSLMATLDGNPGQWDWTPDEAALQSTCRVKVVVVDAGGKSLAEDLSPGLFTIRP